MRILVACEESGIVTRALRANGHSAFSADIQETSGGDRRWHIRGDVSPLLSEPWDAILAFPPCTHLASSGARWWSAKRADGRQQAAIAFFLACYHANAPRVAVENPVGLMSTVFRKPDQIIQPWQFGHGETKATCLWLRGLPPLQATDIVEGRTPRVWRLPPSPDRAKLRSKTYPGVAAAMANQWFPGA